MRRTLESGQPAPVPDKTAKAQGSPQNAGNTTVGSDGEHISNGRTAQELQEETVMPMPRWRRADSVNSSHNAILGAPSEPMDSDGTTGNSTDMGSLNQEDRNRNATIDNVLLNSARQVATISSTPERREDKHRHRRAAIRYNQPIRRRKEIFHPTQEGAAEHSDGATAGVNTSLPARVVLSHRRRLQLPQEQPAGQWLPQVEVATARLRHSQAECD